MAARNDATKSAELPPKLVKALARRMRASLLPGETPLDTEQLEEATRFVLAAASGRREGAALAIESVGAPRRLLRIAIANPDMPFLVDSAAAAIAGEGLAIDTLLHPVVPVERAKDGVIRATPANDAEDADYESLIYIETGRVDAKKRAALRETLAATMADVHAAVGDWPRLQAAMRADADGIEAADSESAALLRWLDGGMLTQLGHLVRHRDGTVSAREGICRADGADLLAEASFERAFAWFDDKAETRELLIVKANHLSRVHRRVPLDLFLVPRREDGKVTALSLHAGVWTSAGLAAPPRAVPRLRAELDGIMSRLDLDAGGHTGKALVHALTALPHDLMIGFAEADVERVATTMMSLVDRPRPRLVLVEAPLARHLFAFVWLPRDTLSTQIRHQIEALLAEGAQAQLLDWSLEVEGGNLALLRFVLDIRDGSRAPDEGKLDAQLQTLLRGWSEAVESELGGLVEPGRAAALALRWADAFPTPFRGRFGAREAARDIARLRALGSHDDIEGGRERDARLYLAEREHPDALRLKLYQAEGSLPLSDAVPTLENFGFHVLTEAPTELDGGKLGTIHDFHLAPASGIKPGDLVARAEGIESAVAAVLNGEAENDSFNRLVPEVGLTAREANWLRAFYRYLRQAGLSYTIYTVVDALARAPEITRALVALFTALHDPAFAGDREAEAEDARGVIRRGLSRVVAINDDRLLRQYQALIGAILRTNAFAPAAEEALAFKIDSALVPGLPKPVPWREIWVYSRRVEGIHLRSGPIARGGLRWSDRRDDFRTEILGLMKAQRVKNAVIVPTGAKGGFYPKQLPDPVKDRDGWAAEGQASYQIFIRTLLSVTDNLIDDRVVHPAGVSIRDGDDPYFVVAADKGTAKFSDVANAIAEERDFWLYDAFASGGSKGYDHKAMGITAKGAWVSVQRHFREMGVDIQAETIRVAGCGDMSGDVFGNGMLLSKAIKLVAAFDHRHIFLDPDPDPAASFAERARMFALPRSSWDDYDKALISKGGGVFPRDAKTVKLSRQAQAVLGLDAKELEPEALITAILRSPVDLLWFGGIGTYVKASGENNVQVGDPANDAMRINGAELRAKVLGEGANLGVTQAGRIEFALAGGRINTDFIDNSAGVDCSDHEVNIKIALAAAKRAGRLTEAKRVQLLASMTDEVAALVLEDNRLQALALSIGEQGGSGAVPPQLRLIEALEDRGTLDRQTEGLAAGDVFERRATEGFGLTRPELAVLLSSAKLVLQDAIEASVLPDDPCLAETLLGYFPAPMRKSFQREIEGHRLRRQIVATKLANRIVNRLGMVHPFEIAEEEGVGLAEVAAAFVASERLFDAADLWAELDTAPMPETARLYLFRHTAGALRSQMADLIRVGGGAMRPSELITQLESRVRQLSEGVKDLLTAGSTQQSNTLTAEFVAMGAPERLAARVTELYDLDGAVGLAALSRSAEIDARALTAAFTGLGERIGLDWAQSVSALMNPSDVWERLLVAGLSRDFQQMRLDFLRRLARRKGAKDDPEGAVGEWAERNGEAIRRFRAMIDRAKAQGDVAPAMLAQIASMARNLLGR
ncbi:NAD-glutamate dehydrogenase [Qipengyuania sediminis]|uniref:NAD-glutamate dehydrogenase n=1 Tax=Qipengyuania sediminis TaxID=1532023 RepID=UPI001059C4ED|nr:NAD-glutamate dehydrogenase domain-containing protein [Qipengyuania sediminis]